MTVAASPPRRRVLSRLALALLALVALVLGFGFLAGPGVARTLLLDAIQAHLHRSASIGEIQINPLTLTMEIRGLSIQDTGSDEVAGFDGLFLNLSSMSLLHGAPVVEEIRLQGPRLHLVRETPDRYNLSDLIDEWLQPSDAPPPRFSISNIQISGGLLEFDDRPTAARHRVEGLSLTLPFLSNLPAKTEIFVEPRFAAVVDGAPISLQGRTKPFSDHKESELALVASDLSLPRFAGYLPRSLAVSIPQGMMDARMIVNFSNDQNGSSALNLSGDLTLRDFVLDEAAGRPLLRLQRLDLSLKGIDPLARRFELGGLSLEGAQAYVRLDEHGDINWNRGLGLRSDRSHKAQQTPGVAKWSMAGLQVHNSSLHWQDDSAQPSFAASLEQIDLTMTAIDGSLASPIGLMASAALISPLGKVERLQVQDAQVNISRRHLAAKEVSASGMRLLLTRNADGAFAGMRPPRFRQEATVAAEAGAATPWSFEIDRLLLAKASARLEDKSTFTKAIQTVDDANLSIAGFSTEPGSSAKVAVDARINRRGRLSASGEIAPAAATAHLKLELRSVDLLPFQPYFAGYVNLAVTRGQISGSGELALDQASGGGLGARYRGSLTIGNFHSVDRDQSADLLDWKSLHLGGIDLRSSPFALAVREVALSDFFARAIVSAEGKLNLMEIPRRESTPAAAVSQALPPDSPSSSPPPIRIDRVTLQGGTIRIADHYVRPNYSARLADIGGRVSGLSSEPGSSADIDLRGKYDGAPVAITGQFNPLSPKPSLDLKAEVRGVEMTPLSPYAQKYAGYAIAKGKLSLFLDYRLDQGRLDARNRIFLDQLSFGEKTESPDAVKLPVTLAVSLLKNRRGEIDVNLPISGSLDDPEFSMAGVVIQVVMNLLSRAVTSPFALLGSLFGEGEELSQVGFATGAYRLDPDALQRLQALAKALEDRPSLKLEITGHAEPSQDAEALRRLGMERQIKARKLARLLANGQEGGSLETVTIAEDEYPELLESAFRHADFPKPRNWLGLTKRLPRNEMEKLLLTHVPAGKEELRQLAEDRARTVADWLTDSGRIPRERIFLMPAKVEDNEADQDSGQVRFSLR